MSPLLQPLSETVNKTRGVVASASALIKGFKGRIDTAVAAAIANGATAEELQPVADLGVALAADSDVLAADVAANS